MESLSEHPRRVISLTVTTGEQFCTTQNNVSLRQCDTTQDKRGSGCKLREQQSGFRPTGSCVDQIFTLRTILEECIEWHALVVSFIVQAVNCLLKVSHKLWNIQAYGIPPRVVNIIKATYRDVKCSLMVNVQMSGSQWTLV